MQLLKLAVIGTGALGRHHARILSGLEGVELVGVADVNAVAGRAVAESCRTQCVADYRDLLDQVDAAVVAVPTVAHVDVASDCLDRRIPVLVEKPLAPSARQARKLVELAEDRETLLQVGHVERFNPAWASALPYLSGPLYIRSERFSAYAFRSMDIGVVHDVMIHDLDLVLSLVGSPVSRVEAFGTTIVGRHEDCVQARLTFASGCVADLSANRVSPSAKRSMQVWSADGCTSIDFAAREVVHYSRSQTLEYGSPLPDRAEQPGADINQMKKDLFGTYLRVQRPIISAADALACELMDFLECVQTGRPPQVSGRDALDSLLVAEQILGRVAQHQREVFSNAATVPLRRAG